MSAGGANTRPAPPPPPLDVSKAWVSRELTHGRQLYRAQFSPDGRLVAAVGQDRGVHLWDFPGGEKRAVLEGHRTWVSALAFHPFGPLLYTADYHGVIHCWDLGTGSGGGGSPCWTAPGADRDNVRALAVTPDGGHLISAGDDGVVKVWNPADGAPVCRLEGHRECVFCLALSPGGEHLVSGDLLGSIRHWDTARWAPVRGLDARLLHTRKENFLADVGGVRSLAFSPGGALLAAGGMKEAKSNAFCPGKPTVLVFDWAAGAVVAELRCKGRSDGPVNALRFLEDGTLAGHTELLHAESELDFWKPARGGPGPAGPVHVVKNHSAYDLSLHPDGRQLLAAGYVSGGCSGNGAQKRFRENYVPNGSALRVFSLYEKPGGEGKEG